MLLAEHNRRALKFSQNIYINSVVGADKHSSDFLAGYGQRFIVGYNWIAPCVPSQLLSTYNGGREFPLNTMLVY